MINRARYILLASFFLFLTTAISQERQQVWDYPSKSGKVYELRTKSGEKIIGSEFERIEPYVDYFNSTNILRYYNFRVYKDSLYGIFSCYGDQLLSPIYQAIGQVSATRFIVKQNGKYGIVGIGDIPILPCYYEWISREGSGAYCIKLNGKYGLIDTNLIEHLPPIYDEIEVAINGSTSEGSDYYLSDHLYCYKTSNTRGIYDRKREKFIHSGNNYYEINWVNANSASSEANYLFYDDANDQLLIIKNNNGETVALAAHDINGGYIPFNTFSIDGSDSNTVQQAYIKDSSGTFVCNLKNGKRTKTYEQIYSYYGRIIFIDNGIWGILDTSFTEIFRFKKYLPSVKDYYPRQPIRNCISDNYYPKHYYDDLDWKDDLLFLCERVDSFDYEITYKVGMINYRTGIIIKPVYDDIRLYKRQNKFIFHCITLDQDNPKYSPKGLDVYSSNLAKIISLKFDTILYSAFHEKDTTPEQILFLQNRNGKVGGIDINGKIIFPFIFDNFAGGFRPSGNISPGVSWYDTGSIFKADLYLLEIDGKKGVTIIFWGVDPC